MMCVPHPGIDELALSSVGRQRVAKEMMPRTAPYRTPSAARESRGSNRLFEQQHAKNTKT
jgi:hypothetical protein